MWSWLMGNWKQVLRRPGPGRASQTPALGPPVMGLSPPPQSLCHCDTFYNLRVQYAFSLRSHVSVSRAHLPGLVIVLYLPQVPAAGLRNPLPRHQVPHHHRGGADFCNDTVTRVCEESSASPRNATSCLGEEFALGEPFRTRLCRHLIRTGCRGHRMTRTANTHKAQSRARKARAHRTPMLWPDSPGGAAEVPRGGGDERRFKQDAWGCGRGLALDRDAAPRPQGALLAAGRRWTTPCMFSRYCR